MSAISAIKKALEEGYARGDEESLIAFLDALLEGDLLVAAGAGEAALPVRLDEDAPAVELGGSRGAEGEALLSAFTGDEELEAWAGWGAARLAVPVTALARAALDAGVHILALNPAGPVGRQLDVVELRQLAAGRRPRSGRGSFAFEPRSGIAFAPPAVPPVQALVDGLRVVCAHNGDIVAATLVELMQPLRSADVDLAIAIELDGPPDPERRQALVELVGAVVTAVPEADLDGIGFVWPDARLAAMIRARIRPAYQRAAAQGPAAGGPAAPGR